MRQASTIAILRLLEMMDAWAPLHTSTNGVKYQHCNGQKFHHVSVSQSTEINCEESSAINPDQPLSNNEPRFTMINYPKQLLEVWNSLHQLTAL